MPFPEMLMPFLWTAVPTAAPGPVCCAFPWWEMVFAVCLLLLSFSHHLRIFIKIFLRSHQFQGTRSFKSNHSRFSELLLNSAHRPSGESRHDWNRHGTFPGYLLANTVCNVFDFSGVDDR